MKITVVIESLPLYQSNVLFKRKTLPNHKQTIVSIQNTHGHEVLSDSLKYFTF